MELRILSPSEDGFLKEISFNHEEIKKELAVRLEKYKGLVYNDDQIKLAKSDRATLNKFKTAIEDKRKEIKNQCLAPYELFEIKIKEILALVDAPVTEIDTQVKKFEEKKKNEKKENIEAIYAEAIGDLKELLPLAKFWDPKWLNVGVNIGTITESILHTTTKARSDLAIITDLKSEYETEIKRKYLDTLLLSEALAVKTKLEEQKRKLEEYNVKQTEKQAEKQKDISYIKNPGLFVAQQQAQQSPPSFPTSPPPTFTQIQDMAQVIPPEIEMIEFRLWVTPEQKLFIRNYILENKIKFGKVR